ncbi:MAG: HYR domain-containing protein, partial [Flavobacteriales bacterium]|nr:HYR domain-containing protein [Flavobacteriales bacterium]
METLCTTELASHNGALSSSMTSSSWSNSNATGSGLFVTNDYTNTCNATGTYNIGTSNVVWTVTDLSGNTSNCTQTVTINDTTAPTFTCPATVTANTAAGTCSAVVNYTIPVAIDNCGNCTSPPTISGLTLLGTNNGAAYYISNSTMTWSAANTAAQNAGGYLLSVNSAAENTYVLNAVTSSLGTFTQYWLGLNDATTEGTFVWSNGQSVTYSNWNGGQPDNAGGVEDYGQVWTAAGTWNDLPGTSNLRYVLELPCVAVTRTVGPASGSTFPIGTTVVTHTATDASGNISTCSFNVVVTDNIAPTVTCPGNQTLALGSSCTVALPDYTSLVTTSDNCTATSALTIVQSPVAGTTITSAGNTVITITVTDAAGNVGTCTFTLTTSDTTAPTVVTPANITANVAPGTCSAVVNYTVSMSDNCTTPSNCAPTSIAGYTLIGIYNGHTYFRSNNTALWPDANTAANALGGHLATISSSGENSYLAGIGTHYIGLNDQTTEGTWVWSNGEPVTYTNWNAGEPNNSGNQDYAVINYSGLFWDDQGTTTTGLLRYIVEFDCSYSLISGLASGSTYPVGTTTNTYTVTDAAGNTSVQTSFTVTVVDNIFPTLSCPSNISTTVTAGSCNRSVLTTNPTYSDNCSVTSLTWTMTGATTNASPLTGINFVGTQTFNSGVTTITYSATDSGSNVSTCSFTVTVSDNIAPTITCPGNIAQNTSGSSCTTSISTTAPTYSDNCTVASLRWTLTGATTASSPLTGINNLGFYTFNAGITTVTYTVTDNAGNSTNCSYQVTITDNVAPVLTCTGNQSANVGVGACTASVATTAPSYSDNCSVTKLTWIMTGATTAASPLTGINTVGTYTFNIGTSTITYYAEDAAGNITNCSFDVVVSDNINPTISCTSNITASTSSSACTATVSTTNPTIADNCAVTRLTWAMTGATIASSAATGINYVGSYTFNPGVTTIVYTARDAANNSNTCSFTVTVTDAVAPTASCPSNVTANVDAGTCEATLSLTNPTVSDNCSLSKVTWVMTGAVEDNSATTGINYVGSYTFIQGTTTITYTVTDASNNSTTCSFDVTVNDNIAPTITCPAAVTTFLNPSDCYASGVSLGIPIVDDNCSIAGISSNAPANFLLGATTVTWTVFDDAGLSANCTQVVTI